MSEAETFFDKATEARTDFQMLHQTLAPDAISDELRPTIEEFGLEDNCRQLAQEGWTVVEDVASPEFNERLRGKIQELGGGNMLLAKDPDFPEAVLSPKLLAMAEFSV